jgi:hypothetical protein
MLACKLSLLGADEAPDRLALSLETAAGPALPTGRDAKVGDHI